MACKLKACTVRPDYNGCCIQCDEYMEGCGGCEQCDSEEFAVECENWEDEEE